MPRPPPARANQSAHLRDRDVAFGASLHKQAAVGASKAHAVSLADLESTGAWVGGRIGGRMVAHGRAGDGLQHRRTSRSSFKSILLATHILIVSATVP